MAPTDVDLRLRIPGFRRYAAEIDRLRHRIADLEADRAALEAAAQIRTVPSPGHASPSIPEPDVPDADRVAAVRTAIDRLGTKALLRLLEELRRDLVTEEAHGVRFAYGSHAEYRRIKTHKPWDEPLAAWVQAFTPGDVFFDIGANIGAFSLLAARLHGESIRVVAFEPGFETFAALSHNILLNGLDATITPLQVALFDESGLQPFHYRRMGAGSAMHAVGEPLNLKRRRFKPVAVQPVMAYTLDDAVARFALPRPTKIKLDVDGVEARVLAGATRTLSSGPCELWVELTEVLEGDPAPIRVTAMLHDLGFELTRRVDHEDTRGTYPRLHDALFIRR